MGYEQKSVTIIGRVSRHNSWRDRRDDALWDGFIEALDALMHDPLWAALDLSEN